MSPAIINIISIVVAIIGSGGFWAFLQFLLEKRSSTRMMLLGLGYNALVTKCEEYIAQGFIPIEEFDELNKYLYEPYIKMGGNGTAKKLMERVTALPYKQA